MLFAFAVVGPRGGEDDDDDDCPAMHIVLQLGRDGRNLESPPSRYVVRKYGTKRRQDEAVDDDCCTTIVVVATRCFFFIFLNSIRRRRLQLSTTPTTFVSRMLQ